MKRLLSLVALASTLIIGCGPKADPVPIDDLKLHKDEIRNFEILLPSNWIIQKVPGELLVATTSRESARRFLNFQQGPAGAKIELRVAPVDSTRVLDTVIKNMKLTFKDGLDRYVGPEETTLGGRKAKKLTVEFFQKDGNYNSEAYFVEHDSTITVLQLSAFGSTFGDYREAFDKIIASVKVGQRPKVVEAPKDTVKRGPEPPSDTLRPVAGPDYTLEIPKNFQGSRTTTSGTISSMSFAGSRLDCTIQIDVFDASKQNNLSKILDQNKDKYGGAAATMTTLSGQKAGYFSYNPVANVSSRAYFMVKGDRMYRITLNWFKPEQNVYLPLFERVLKTLSVN